MTIFLSIVGVLATLIAIVLIHATTKSAAFVIQRSTTIAAPPEKVFAFLDDFHHWASWSPWEKLDPALTRSFSGAPRGKGAVYAWKGNKKVGEGRMEITEATASTRLAITLDFLKPFEAHNVAEYTLTPANGGTVITWAMKGPRPYMMKVMSTFCDMDRMIGKDFEAGLANLKRISEAA